jgi:anhydro-N-acetylmuramic acid kinase
MNKKYYIGAMSGTSFDAIDVSVIRIQDGISLEFFHSKKIPSQIKSKIRSLINKEIFTLSELGKLDKQIGSLFSSSIKECIYKNKLQKSSVGCVAISGQTICHEVNKKNSFSMQIGDPNIIATETQLPVIYDFRNMHIALGGEGAPLVPEFHNELFYKKGSPKIILNLGGISNYTYVSNKKNLWGSDVGPGNAIMDAYCQKFLGKPFDKDGSIASKGKINKPELQKLLSNKFFKKSFPKSTGKELFNLSMLSPKFIKESSENVLATLAEFSALCVANAIKQNKHKSQNIIICGGGGNNKFLVKRISDLIPGEVTLSSALGYDIQAIESMAFAWLGFKRLSGEPLRIQLGKNKFNKGLLGSITKSK